MGSQTENQLSAGHCIAKISHTQNYKSYSYNEDNLLNFVILRSSLFISQPVRGEQSNRESIFPNKCTFNIEQCLADRTRSPPLVLSANQDNIVYPSVGGK